MISIIIPTYNCGRFLIKTLVALEQQSYKDFEVIIVDDGSTDDTQGLLDQYQRLVPPFPITRIKQEHQGNNTARNVGFDHSKGSYLLFLDADKILKADALGIYLESLKKNPHKVYAYCNYERDGVLHKCEPFNTEKLKTGELLIDTCSLVKKEKFLKFDPKLKRLQDRDLWLTLLGNGAEGVFINNVLFETFSREGDITSSEDLQKAEQYIQKKHKQHKYGKHALKGLVDIIILRFNIPEYDKRCVEAVINNTCYPFCKITLFDNYYSRFTLSKIWNILIQNSIGEFICLLNNDTRPSKEWLSKMLKVFEKEKGVGAVGPSTNQCKTPQKVRVPPVRYEIVDFEKQYKKDAQLSGFCLLFPKQVWKEVGGFDERFGFYAQENEFLHRVQKAGYKTIWRKDAYVWHKGEASGRKLEKEEGFDVQAERKKGHKLYKKMLKGEQE